MKKSIYEAFFFVNRCLLIIMFFFYGVNAYCSHEKQEDTIKNLQTVTQYKNNVLYNLQNKNFLFHNDLKTFNEVTKKLATEKVELEDENKVLKIQIENHLQHISSTKIKEEKNIREIEELKKKLEDLENKKRSETN